MKKTPVTILNVALVMLATVFFLSSASATAQDGIVSLNKASVEELMAIEDLEMDEDIAQAIVAYRKQKGGFKKPEDLLDVPGMTQDWFEEINPVMMEGDVVYDPDAEPALAPSKC